MINYDGLSFESAKLVQEELRKQLISADHFCQHITTIAGTDISYNKDSTLMFGAIVILSFPEMKVKAYSLATAETNFPYKAGYLGFREIPTLLKAWEQISAKPDLVVLDGQGILHPRRLGVASHFGVLTSHPTIGCAKDSLHGFHEEPSATKYSDSEVFEKNTNEHIGYALRTKNHTASVYVSPGHRVTLPQSIAIIKKCVVNHRIPEPTRMAHQFANDFRTGKLKAGFHELNSPLALF